MQNSKQSNNQYTLTHGTVYSLVLLESPVLQSGPVLLDLPKMTKNVYINKIVLKKICFI